MWQDDEIDFFDDASTQKQSKKNKKKEPQLLDESGLRRKAVDLLARREYSFFEIEKKLLPVAESEELAYSALEWLTENGLQSDARFCEMYIRSKALSGYGPVRIKQELKQKGISSGLMETCFEEQEINWEDELGRLTDKKMRGTEKGDLKSKQKCMGFLQRRGFTLDQIYKAIDHFYDLQE